MGTGPRSWDTSAARDERHQASFSHGGLSAQHWALLSAQGTCDWCLCRARKTGRFSGQGALCPPTDPGSMFAVWAGHSCPAAGPRNRQPEEEPEVGVGPQVGPGLCWGPRQAPRPCLGPGCPSVTWGSGMRPLCLWETSWGLLCADLRIGSCLAWGHRPLWCLPGF